MRKITAVLAAALISAAAYVPAAAPAAAAVQAASSAPAPTSAAEMNARMASIEGIGDLFDIGRTELLPDGRWLMLTGDANTQAGQPYPVYDNAAIIFDAAGQRRVASPHPGGHFFPRWEDGSEFWPNDFFVVGDRGYVIGSRIKAYDGAFNWDDLGTYGAVFAIPAGGTPSFLRYFPTPASLVDVSEVQWSGGLEYDGQYVYVHGVLDKGPDRYHARDGGYVARVPLDKLEVPHRWTFWTGTAWAARVDKAVATIPLDQKGPNCGADAYGQGGDCWGTSSGYTLHRRPGGGWQVTTKAAGDIAEGVTAYRSASPRGPWTKVQLAPAAAVCSFNCYLVGAAPTIPTSSGKLLVMYSTQREASGPVPGAVRWLELAQ